MDYKVINECKIKVNVPRDTASDNVLYMWQRNLFYPFHFLSRQNIPSLALH